MDGRACGLCDSCQLRVKGFKEAGVSDPTLYATTSSKLSFNMLPEPFTPKFLTQLETLRLRTRKEFLGSHTGSYSSPRRGTSLEFADYRRYTPGDDLRYLDWGIYARTDRLYVKVFREEVDLFAYVFIDASASMAFPSREQKFLPATHVGLALSLCRSGQPRSCKAPFVARRNRAKLDAIFSRSAAHDRLRALRHFGGPRRHSPTGARRWPTI